MQSDRHSKFGCSGCLGITLSCWHSFSCGKDPAISNHPCPARSTPILESLLVAAFVFIIVMAMMGKI